MAISIHVIQMSSSSDHMGQTGRTLTGVLRSLHSLVISTPGLSHNTVPAYHLVPPGKSGAARKKNVSRSCNE